MASSADDLVRDIHQKLQVIVRQVHKVEQHGADIQQLRKDVDSMQEVFTEFENILIVKRKIRRITVYCIGLVITAALTTYVNFHVNKALLQRDEPEQQRAVENSRVDK